MMLGKDGLNDKVSIDHTVVSHDQMGDMVGKLPVLALLMRHYFWFGALKVQIAAAMRLSWSLCKMSIFLGLSCEHLSLECPKESR